MMRGCPVAIQRCLKASYSFEWPSSKQRSACIWGQSAEMRAVKQLYFEKPGQNQCRDRRSRTSTVFVTCSVIACSTGIRVSSANDQRQIRYSPVFHAGAVAGNDSRLPVERRVIAVFADHHLREQRRRRRAAGVSRSGAGACANVLQARQAYFGHGSDPRSCARIQSSISPTLSPLARSTNRVACSTGTAHCRPRGPSPCR